jgi:hypothetical protein
MKGKQKQGSGKEHDIGEVELQDQVIRAEGGFE